MDSCKIPLGESKWIDTTHLVENFWPWKRPVNWIGRITKWHSMGCHAFYYFIEKNKFYTKQNKALHNRTAPALQASVPCFPGMMHGLLASDIHDWINRESTTSLALCLCQVVLASRLGCFVWNLFFWIIDMPSWVSSDRESHKELCRGAQGP